MSVGPTLKQRLAELDARISELDAERASLLQQRREILNHATKDTDVGLSTEQKLKLFQGLFSGRNDVYATRWEDSQGRSGYAVACGNEWKPGICFKPKIKCGECKQRQYLQLDTHVLHSHLTGQITVGIYPLLPDDRCWFLAVDFDKSDWRESVAAVREACVALDIDCAIERSRSGNGAHLWIFFSEPVPAVKARLLGSCLLDTAMEQYPKLGFDSYDRLFPNQDHMPAGGFGNLIALPLQFLPRKQGNSVFVDRNFNSHPDQWAFLSNIKRLSRSAMDAHIEALIHHNPEANLLSESPWEASLPISDSPISGCPSEVDLVLANMVYIKTSKLPSQLVARLKRLATFSNLKFFKTQAMRFSTAGIPRLITCARLEGGYLGLPRGCLESIEQLLAVQGSALRIEDKRQPGKVLETLSFSGTLRHDQRKAVSHMLERETGVLHAPTAFGKTVTSIGIIAERKVSTLILVHSRELVLQWKERLNTFLTGAEIGVTQGSKNKFSGHIDVATYQSFLTRGDNSVKSQAFEYGQVIVDECHHLSAPRYEFLLNELRPRFVLGLTATPQRQDGHQPIIFMQAGPLRYKAPNPKHAVFKQKVIHRKLDFLPPVELLGTDQKPHITDIFRWLIENKERSDLIVRDVIDAVRRGRNPLVLTERRGHAEHLARMLNQHGLTTSMLRGGMAAKQRQVEADRLPESQVVIATGKYVGEGFDLPRLDTLFLAMPISWKGTLAQYAGRVHRVSDGKTEVQIYDYVDAKHPVLERMFSRRCVGYRAMGYEFSEITDGEQPVQSELAVEAP